MAAESLVVDNLAFHKPTVVLEV